MPETPWVRPIENRNTFSRSVLHSSVNGIWELDQYGDHRLKEFVYPFLRTGDSVGLTAALKKHFCNQELASFLSHPDTDTVKIAVVCLSLTGRMSEYDRLARLLHHPDPFVGCLVEYALWSISFRAPSEHQSYLLRRAVHLVRDEEMDQALLLLNRLLVENPDFAEAYYQRALVHHTRGDYGASIEDCRRALELNPSHYGACAQMGHACTQTDHYDQALDCYYAALNIHPRMEGLHEAVRCLRRILARSHVSRAHA